MPTASPTPTHPDGAPASGQAAQELYDARYFDAELHRDHWFKNNAAKRARRWEAVRTMLDLKRTDRVLEIGCATGEHAVRIAAEAREVVGIDLAPAAIERARRRAAERAIDNVVFETADAADLGRWPSASFDKVAAIDFVEHVDDATLAAILGEAYRVLVPGGRLAIYTPCATHYVEWLKARNLLLRQTPGHIAVRPPERYQTLLADARFGDVATRFLPSDYPVFGWVDRTLVSIPWLGAWFRFRICTVAIKSTA